MTPIDKIVLALRDGAAASNPTVIAELHAHLEHTLRTRFGVPNSDSPAGIEEELRMSGAGEDREIVMLAERILALLQASAAPEGERGPARAAGASGMDVDIGSANAGRDQHFINTSNHFYHRPSELILIVVLLAMGSGVWALTRDNDAKDSPPVQAPQPLLLQARDSVPTEPSQIGLAALKCARTWLGETDDDAAKVSADERISSSVVASLGAALVSRCFVSKAGARPFPKTESADALYRLFERNGWLYRPSPGQDPQPGDVAFWRRDDRIFRVAIVGTVEGAYFIGIQQDTAGVHEKRREIYAVSLVAYGHVPDSAVMSRSAPSRPE